jgi:hypothetical protein
LPSCCCALWALLPLVATRWLGLGAGGYGILLGALGSGAVVGVLLLPRLWARLSNNRLMMGATLVYGALLAVLVVTRQANRFVEQYTVLSWDEHLRQHHDRLTETDAAIDRQALAFAESAAPASHLFPADV